MFGPIESFWKANGVEIWPFPFRSLPFRFMSRSVSRRELMCSSIASGSLRFAKLAELASLREARVARFAHLTLAKKWLNLFPQPKGFADLGSGKLFERFALWIQGRWIPRAL